MFCWIPPPISRFSGSLSQILTCWGFLEMTCKNIIRWFKQRNTLSHLFEESSFLMELSLQNFCSLSLSLWAGLLLQGDGLLAPAAWRDASALSSSGLQQQNHQNKVEAAEKSDSIAISFCIQHYLFCSWSWLPSLLLLQSFRTFSPSLGWGFQSQDSCKKTNYLSNWIEWKFRRKRAKNGRLWNWIEWKFQ